MLDRQDNALFAWRRFRRATQATELLRGVEHDDVQELAREVFAPERVLRMVQR